MTASDIESDINLIMTHAQSIEYLGQLVATDLPDHMPQLANAIMALAEDQQRNWDRMIDALYRLENGDTNYNYYAGSKNDPAQSENKRIITISNE